MDYQMEEMQLASLLEQYDNVEKEMHNLSSELGISQKKRRQLHAEVKFLRRKVKSFRENGNGNVPTDTRHVAAAPERKKSKSKRKEEPKFFEVKIQYAESMEARLMNRGLYPHPSHLQDYRINYIPYSDHHRWGHGTSYIGNAEVM